VFDELGIDHLFIDESHYFKNLEAPTKMDRVAGIQTGGSERAFDLYMKCRYLDQQHAGHGVTFATGTPISNTMVEMYTIQRFLDPHGLVERGIDHFDAWAATFGEVMDAMEISPDGKTLPAAARSCFARFTNLPELQQMFRAFADVKTVEMLNLPRPYLHSGKATVVACPMSEQQREAQAQLIQRYEDVRSGKKNHGRITRWRSPRIGASWPSMRGCSPRSPRTSPAPKSTPWWSTSPARGTQLIFSDMGVHPTDWGYSVYQEVIDKLVQQGIPREQIASIGDADTDAKKQALFDKVRVGTVRVLLGSTQKMGTGTNVHKRLAALHHLDAPWKPAEVEQRDGRILRQGNTNAEVAIYRYVTEGSFDAYMWQALEAKARFIAQGITGDSTVRQAEDIGGQELSYAEVKRLAVLKKHYANEQVLARRAMRELPGIIARLERRMADLTQDSATATAHAEVRPGGGVGGPGRPPASSSHYRLWPATSAWASITG
jgi:hypothetical protein